MGKFEKKRKKKKSAFRPVLIGIVLAAILIAAALFVMPKVLYRLTEGPEETEEVQTEQIELPENKQPENIQSEQTGIENAITFPMILEDGKLEVERLFQFNGVNPDCGNEEEDDIAAILLKNTSAQYLKEATIAMTLADGTRVNFAITDLPAGKSVMAFSTENQRIPDNSVCVAMNHNVVFAEVTDYSDKIAVAVAGTQITLTNQTGEDISELVVYCRSPLGEDYFGGITYQYPVSNLPANGSVTVDAVDCILGIAEVIHIEIN